jgi:hypothetical protein
MTSAAGFGCSTVPWIVTRLDDSFNGWHPIYRHIVILWIHFAADDMGKNQTENRLALLDFVGAADTIIEIRVPMSDAIVLMKLL